MFSRPAIKAQMGFCSLGCRLNRFILWWKGKGQGAAVALGFLPLGSWFLGGGAGKCPPGSGLALSRRWLACCAAASSVRGVDVSRGALLFKAF